MTLLQEPLVHAILGALADESRGGLADGAGVSLPRLGKRLGQGASVLMRQLTLMGDASVGGQRGPGWVRVVQANGRWMVYLTDEGRAASQNMPVTEGTL